MFKPILAKYVFLWYLKQSMNICIMNYCLIINSCDLLYIVLEEHVSRWQLWVLYKITVCCSSNKMCVIPDGWVRRPSDNDPFVILQTQHRACVTSQYFQTLQRLFIPDLQGKKIQKCEKQEEGTKSEILTGENTEEIWKNKWAWKHCRFGSC